MGIRWESGRRNGGAAAGRGEVWGETEVYTLDKANAGQTWLGGRATSSSAFASPSASEPEAFLWCTSDDYK